MVPEGELLRTTAELAARFLATLETRPITPAATYHEARATFDGPLPAGPADPRTVVEALARDADAGLTGMPSGRFFGFVIGGSLPASLAADWLVTAWDQNTGLAEATPATSAIEEVAGRWVLELLGLPAHSSFAFVTGCQMAHVTALAAARHAVYERHGYDLPTRGLAGAPPLRAIVGAQRHVTVTRALRLLGIGSEQEVVIACDDQGRMATRRLAEALDPGVPTIVCAQAGEVNTGAFDDLEAIREAAHGAGAWVHVDGAFGLWAAASPAHAHLLTGHGAADSWATDAHKWLNVPYDCGIAICAHPAAHAAAMEYAAPYLAVSDRGSARDPMGYSPEFSRRARGVPVYAAIRELGRSGIAELVDRCCCHARAIGAALSTLPGCTVLNEVVLNQVMVRFDDDETTREVLAAIHREGVVYPSHTAWQGRPAIRISVSNWRTDEADVEQLIAAFRRGPSLC